MSLFGRLRSWCRALRGSLSGAPRSHYRSRALDPNRSEGERPYADLSDEQVKRRYVKATLRVRNADSGGLHLSPIIDRGSNLRGEWRKRGNDVDELDAALEAAGGGDA